MTEKLYELRLTRQGRAVKPGYGEPDVISLDLDSGEQVRTLLDRYLLGAAKRDRAKDDELHFYQCTIRQISELDHSRGPKRGPVLFWWSLPASPGGQ